MKRISAGAGTYTRVAWFLLAATALLMILGWWHVLAAKFVAFGVAGLILLAIWGSRPRANRRS